MAGGAAGGAAGVAAGAVGVGGGGSFFLWAMFCNGCTNNANARAVAPSSCFGLIFQNLLEDKYRFLWRKNRKEIDVRLRMSFYRKNFA
jgi:hypothetical protein